MPGIQDAIAAIMATAGQGQPAVEEGRPTRELVSQGKPSKELKHSIGSDSANTPDTVSRKEDQPEESEVAPEDGGKIMRERKTLKGDGKADNGEEPKPSDVEEAEETAINTENFMKAIGAILRLIGGGAGSTGAAAGRAIGNQMAGQGQEVMPGYANSGIAQGIQQAPMMPQMPAQQGSQMVMPPLRDVPMQREGIAAPLRDVPMQREGIAAPLRDVPVMRNRAEER